jgi:hypothetical protein
MIPTWLVQLGSIAGLLAFCLTIWDRLLSSRPLVWICADEQGRLARLVLLRCLIASIFSINKDSGLG